jgi:hypothetical protein
MKISKKRGKIIVDGEKDITLIINRGRRNSDATLTLALKNDKIVVQNFLILRNIKKLVLLWKIVKYLFWKEDKIK